MRGEEVSIDGLLDTQLLVQPTEGITDDVQLVPQLLHHAVDAGSVFENVHALGVGVVSHREGTLDGLGKLPEMTPESSPRPDSRLISCLLMSSYETYLILTLASSKLSDTK